MTSSAADAAWCPARIAVVELSSRDLRHAAFNAMLLRVVSLAVPEASIAFWADASHCARVGELLRETSVDITFHPIRLSEHRVEKMSLVSSHRLWRDLVNLWRVIRAGGHGPTLMVVSSASATGISACWFTRWLPGAGRRAIQFVLHGEVNALRDGWRTRHPLYRRLDLRAVLERCHSTRFRYLVLDSAITDTMVREVPGLAGWIDSMPLPAVETDGNDWEMTALTAPVELGLVGVATRAKGFDIYVSLAKSLAREAPGQLRFNLVGRLHPDFAATDLSALTPPIGFTDLPHASFVARLRRLHYVCIPYQGGYYDWGASGAALDAVTSRKPLIVFRTPLTEHLFSVGGDVGHLCHDEKEMAAVLRQLALAPDPERYRRQVAAVDALYRSRTPSAIAASYRQTLHRLLG